jgi:hypothetical protein
MHCTIISVLHGNAASWQEDAGSLFITIELLAGQTYPPADWFQIEMRSKILLV